MLEWILKNKEWIFSGIGIPVIAVIFKIIKNFRKEKILVIFQLLWKGKKSIFQVKI